MKKIIQLLNQHLKSEGQILFLIGWIAFLSLLIALNYTLDIRCLIFNSPLKALYSIIFYALPYGMVTGWYAYCFKKHTFLSDKRFYVCSVAILAVCINNEFFIWYDITSFHPAIQYFVHIIGYNTTCCITYLAVPLMYWYGTKNNKTNAVPSPTTSFYGLTTKNFDYKPYLLMLSLMLPLLIWASFQPSFLSLYPRYKVGSAEIYWQIPSWQTQLAYEITYIGQFFSLELFFRGFIVFVLARWVGGGSIWLMVTIYVLLHFGKPLPETIGSFFGGYILGVISFYTRSIFGGVLIHVGVALLMDLLAYSQLFNLDLISF